MHLDDGSHEESMRFSTFKGQPSETVLEMRWANQSMALEVCSRPSSKPLAPIRGFLGLFTKYTSGIRKNCLPWGLPQGMIMMAQEQSETEV